jgi:hypothetical protein
MAILLHTEDLADLNDSVVDSDERTDDNIHSIALDWALASLTGFLIVRYI